MSSGNGEQGTPSSGQYPGPLREPDAAALASSPYGGAAEPPTPAVPVAPTPTESEEYRPQHIATTEDGEVIFTKRSRFGRKKKAPRRATPPAEAPAAAAPAAPATPGPAAAPLPGSPVAPASVAAPGSSLGKPTKGEPMAVFTPPPAPAASGASLPMGETAPPARPIAGPATVPGAGAGSPAATQPSGMTPTRPAMSPAAHPRPFAAQPAAPTPGMAAPTDQTGGIRAVPLSRKALRTSAPGQVTESLPVVAAGAAPAAPGLPSPTTPADGPATVAPARQTPANDLRASTNAGETHTGPLAAAQADPVKDRTGERASATTTGSSMRISAASAAPSLLAGSAARKPVRDGSTPDDGVPSAQGKSDDAADDGASPQSKRDKKARKAAQRDAAGKVRGRRRRWPIVVLIVAVLLAAAAVAGSLMWRNIQERNATQYAPDKTVSQYLKLVQDGKIEQAGKLAEPTGDSTNTQLLSDSVYAKVTDHITQVVTAASAVNGKTATVDGSYLVGDQPVQTQYSLTLAGKQNRFYNKWAMRPVTLPTLTVTSDQPGTVTVAGVDVTSTLKKGDDGKYTATFLAYPGTYPVTYTDPEGTFAETGLQVRVVDSNPSAIATLTAQVDEAKQKDLAAKVDAQLRPPLDQCVQSSLTGDTCSAALKSEGEYIKGKQVTSIAVSAYPTVAVSYDPASGKWSYTATRGDVAVTGKSGGQDVVRHTAVEVSGSITINQDGSVSITADWK